jgi:hypothetical protein
VIEDASHRPDDAPADPDGSGPEPFGPNLLTFLVVLGAIGGILLMMLGLPMTGGALVLLSLAGHFALRLR